MSLEGATLVGYMIRESCKFAFKLAEIIGRATLQLLQSGLQHQLWKLFINEFIDAVHEEYYEKVLSFSNMLQQMHLYGRSICEPVRDALTANFIMVLPISCFTCFCRDYRRSADIGDNITLHSPADGGGAVPQDAEAMQAGARKVDRENELQPDSAAIGLDRCGHL